MIRVGSGLDVHRLVEGRPLILGGVKIPSDKGCLGHSDADALVHSIIDSLLGALALGDIGTFFPDTDNQFKDISSLILLERTAKLIKDAGYRVVNIDSNIVLQSPKLSDYKKQMVEVIASTLGIDSSCVCVKAKTAEKMLGELGTSDAVLAQSTVLLESVK